MQWEVVGSRHAWASHAGLVSVTLSRDGMWHGQDSKGGVQRARQPTTDGLVESMK